MSDTLERVCAKLSEQYPHQVTVPHYVERMYAGELPRPEHIRPLGGSWPSATKKDPGRRTVGFTTAEALAKFKKEWKL